MNTEGTLPPAALDEIEQLRAADAEWSDLCNKQNALLEELHKLASPQICGWCHLASGDAEAAREMATKYTLDEVREHTKSCPNNPLVVEIEMLRKTLAQPHMEWASDMHSVGVDIASEDVRLRAEVQRLQFAANDAAVSHCETLRNALTEALDGWQRQCDLLPPDRIAELRKLVTP